MWNQKALMLTFYLVFFFLTGCGGYQPLQAEEVSPLQLGEDAIVDQTMADESKKIVLSLEEVIEVKGVCLEESIYLSPAVKHFDRLHLENIRKRGFDKVKKRYPNANVHLSTDKKIFMELEKLENQLKQKQISQKTLDTRLKKLEKDMKG